MSRRCMADPAGAGMIAAGRCVGASVPRTVLARVEQGHAVGCKVWKRYREAVHAANKNAAGVFRRANGTEVIAGLGGSIWLHTAERAQDDARIGSKKVSEQDA